MIEMPNVQQGFDTSPFDAYYAIPPITRWLFTTITAVSCVVNFGLLSPFLLTLNWSLVLKLQVLHEMLFKPGGIKHRWLLNTTGLQIWRLFTPFMYLGGFSFGFLIQLGWL